MNIWERIKKNNFYSFTSFTVHLIPWSKEDKSRVWGHCLINHFHTIMEKVGSTINNVQCTVNISNITLGTLDKANLLSMNNLLCAMKSAQCKVYNVNIICTV